MYLYASGAVIPIYAKITRVIGDAVVFRRFSGFPDRKEDESKLGIFILKELP
jgi:hypothetical protein